MKPVEPVDRGKRQCFKLRARDRDPVRGRMHLLDGKIQVTRSHILHGEKLDLLEMAKEKNTALQQIIEDVQSILNSAIAEAKIVLENLQQ